MTDVQTGDRMVCWIRMGHYHPPPHSLSSNLTPGEYGQLLQDEQQSRLEEIEACPPGWRDADNLIKYLARPGRLILILLFVLTARK